LPSETQLFCRTPLVRSSALWRLPRNAYAMRVV